MPNIELRLKAGTRSEGDLVLTVQDKTFDYLMVSPAKEIRVSAYFDRDYPQVADSYVELFVSDSCGFKSKIVRLIPGSKIRGKVTLPGLMEEGEQLTILVEREPIS